MLEKDCSGDAAADPLCPSRRTHACNADKRSRRAVADLVQEKRLGCHRKYYRCAKLNQEAFDMTLCQRARRWLHSKNDSADCS